MKRKHVRSSSFEQSYRQSDTPQAYRAEMRAFFLFTNFLIPVFFFFLERWTLRVRCTCLSIGYWVTVCKHRYIYFQRIPCRVFRSPPVARQGNRGLCTSTVSAFVSRPVYAVQPCGQSLDACVVSTVTFKWATSSLKSLGFQE